MARIVIDGSTVTRGGGFTYLVNVLPQLIERGPEHQFRLLLRNAVLADSNRITRV